MYEITLKKGFQIVVSTRFIWGTVQTQISSLTPNSDSIGLR